MSQSERETLVEMNRKMVVAEDTSDEGYLREVLDEYLIFRRANRTCVGRTKFLEGLSAAANRDRSVVGAVGVETYGDTALVVLFIRSQTPPPPPATAESTTDAGPSAAGPPQPTYGVFINRRVFVKRPQGWRCIMWFNERLDG